MVRRCGPAEDFRKELLPEFLQKELTRARQEVVTQEHTAAVQKRHGDERDRSGDDDPGLLVVET